MKLNYRYTLAYAAEFNLPLREFPSGPSLYYVKGQRFIHQDGTPWPATFTFDPAELSQGADSIIFNHEDLAELGNPLDPSWPTGASIIIRRSSGWPA